MTSIAEFMSQDHDRLDAIFADFRSLSSAGKGEHLFSQFDAGLRAHILWEEELLFPPFEEKTGMRSSGPTAVMRVEHQQIKQLLATIRGRIGSTDVEESLDSLVEVLTAHNQKEESILYPWIDQLLTEQEKSILLDRIKASAAEA